MMNLLKSTNLVVVPTHEIFKKTELVIVFCN